LHSWESDAKAQLYRLATIWESINDKAVIEYLKVLEGCSISGIEKSVSSFIADPDPTFKRPKPGQVLDRVPASARPKSETVEPAWYHHDGSWGGEWPAKVSDESARMIVEDVLRLPARWDGDEPILSREQKALIAFVSPELARLYT
jgi:hypothetical protein